MTYTQWLLKLISIIMVDSGLSIDEIALTDSDCFAQYKAGVTPEHLYFNVWEGCAGNYYAIKF